MFDCHPNSITNGLKQLEKIGYISMHFDIKGGGGKIRFIKDLRLRHTRDCESDSQETVSPYIKVNKIKDIRGVKSKKNYQIGEKEFTLDQVATGLLSHYNNTLGKKYRTVDTFISNLEYWLTVYSPEEIVYAIKQMPGKNFFGNLSIETLFRQKTPKGEKADYIGALVNGNYRKEATGGVIESWLKE
jgi:hypothetical protein